MGSEDELRKYGWQITADRPYYYSQKDWELYLLVERQPSNTPNRKELLEALERIAGMSAREHKIQTY